MNFCIRVCAFVCPGLAKGPMEHNKPVNLLLENLIQFNFFVDSIFTTVKFNNVIKN